MKKIYVKLFLWLVLLALGAAALLGTLRAIGELIVYFQAGADPATALNIVPNVPLDLKVELTWLPTTADTGREIEPFTRTQVESAYLRAWLQWNISYLRAEPYGLSTYFSGPALDAVQSSVTTINEQGGRIEQTDLTHHLDLHFYSADGSTVSFTDHDVSLVQIVRDAAGEPVLTGETTATYDVVMFLEDGNWRVRHWLRTAGAAVTAPADGGTAVANENFVTRDGNELWWNGRVFTVAGINYYPQDTPWSEFWPAYDEVIVAQDLALIQSLGLNTVRIFIPFEQFGGADVDAAYLAKLDNFLFLAGQNELKVIVTLFDYRSDYQILLWPNADRHLETILTAFADDPNILAWDIKNEPDKDYGQGAEMVNAWLRHVAQMARQYDPTHLVTIGWSLPEAAAALSGAVDFVSFHYYNYADQLPERYGAVATAVPDRPIVITEFGVPTWNSPFFPGGHTESEQAAYYADVLAFVDQAETAGTVAWTLYDFPHIPGGAVSSLPWRSGPEKHLGIIDGDGQPKMAAYLVSPDAFRQVARPSALARLMKPFWLVTAVISLIILVIIGSRLLRWVILTWLSRKPKKKAQD